MKEKIFTATLIDNGDGLTLEEVCRTVHIDKDTIIEMIEYEVISPQGKAPDEYLFDSNCLSRLKKAISFYQDLEVNFAGISLAFELLDRIQELETQLNIEKK